ncbi:MAG: hypothetical protein U0R44_00890 [Candidatus Micrarchaeia archaeon]
MKILVFGLENENRLLPRLRKRFPHIGFVKHEPSSELGEDGPEIIAIDTVKGIAEVSLIDDLDSLSPGRSLEGSGMLLTLRILLKIGSIKSVRIIAVPPSIGEGEAFEAICAVIETLA